MTTHGPFHSLTDNDKQALAARLSTGTSVRQAALEVGANYGHALNYAHSLGYGHRRTINQQALDKAVNMVAAGKALKHAAEHCGVPRRDCCWCPSTKKATRGDAATTQRVEYLLLRLSALTRTDAAAACHISARTGRDFDKGLVQPKSGRRARFIAQGRDAVAYNKLMTALLTTTDVIEPGRQAEPANSQLIDPYREISNRYLSLIDRERIFDLRKAGNGVREIARILGRAPSTISRELKRNRTAAGPYGPLAAQRKATARRLRPKKAVIASDPELKALIQDKISNFWSP